MSARLLGAWSALGVGLSLGLAAVGCDDCGKGQVDTKADAAPAASAGGGSASASGPAPRTIEGGVVNASPVKDEVVAGYVNPEKLPAYSGPTGSVQGTITVIGDPAPPSRLNGDFSKCKSAEATWGKAFREGPPGPGGARPLADAIVVVTGYKGFFIPEKTEAKRITVEDCAYTTLTATLTFGQRLEVKNLSTEFWTPLLEPGPNMVMMVATPKGDPVKIYPKEPGHYLLLDRDRKYAVVDVYAFLHPLHASTDTLGRYRIDGVPAGKLKVSSTHPHVEFNAEKEVDIAPGAVQTVDLVLKNVNRDAGPSQEKDAGFHPVLR